MRTPSDKDFEWARNIINILQNYNFTDALLYQGENCFKEELGYWKWRKDNSVKAMLAQNNLHLFSGASKVCVISDDSDWVIKAGFQRHSSKWNYMKQGPNDYCIKEFYNFTEAYDKGFDNFFAAIYFIGCFDGIDFFLQEKVEPNEEFFSDKTYQYCSSNSEYYDSDDVDNETQVRAILEDIIDPSELESFIDFLWNQDINDLHTGNWGVNSEGQIVIFDYSGYGTSSREEEEEWNREN